MLHGSNLHAVTTRTAIVGIGSYHTQDQLGWLVCDRLIDQDLLSKCEIIKCTTPAELPEVLGQFQKTIILDACLVSDGEGSIKTISMDELANNLLFQQSSHGMGVTEALMLCKALKCLPASLTLLALGICADTDTHNLISNEYIDRIVSTIDSVQTAKLHERIEIAR